MSSVCGSVLNPVLAKFGMNAIPVATLRAMRAHRRFSNKLVQEELKITFTPLSTLPLRGVISNVISVLFAKNFLIQRSF